ncbi:hypothetical protein BUALT_Bualt10G0013900 [Buddleja alternifolia]|uniref:Ubiquitin carboxyl-terminal hydrolase n=1 Tax=Buddleja alternifolia TaxID=168488 RepID=A0AAV6X007_9LAMI|nr:hypothetical protein BUALT_Bualt10G0013900 [Buddleja alternifolia]
MENETENSSAPPDLIDSSKTLGNYQSPSSDQSSADELLDSHMALEDESSEAKEFETEEDDELLNCSPITVFPSASDSHSMQPLLSESNEFCRKPLENHLPEEKSMGVEANTSLSTWLYQNKKPAITGAGLANLGNTCFLNAVLQCFIHTVPLLHGILLDKQIFGYKCNKEGFCVLCSLSELVELSLTPTNTVVAPGSFANNLSYISSSFERFQQEDAHEFLQCFLDRLGSCHDSEQKERDNLVKQVFGGRLVSKLKCCNCGHCSDTYEPSIDLSLEIEDADNLLTALQSFTKVEKIEDPETKFTCEECTEQVTIEKQLAFDQAPSVAAFHLKRFKNDGCFVQKIDKHVAFPLDLDLLPFTCTSKENIAELKYVLYAIVVHIGLTSTSGHYYCFIRLSPNTWCKFDDSKVVLVHENFVLSQEAYILFYAKEGTSWFSSFIETHKLCVESNIWNTSPKSVLDTSMSPILQNKISSDSIEASATTGSKPRAVENNEIKDSGPRHIKLECNRSKDNLHKMPVSVAPFASNSDVSLPEARKQFSPTLLEKSNKSQEVGAVKSSIITPQTPPRSPSPEIYREDPPDAGFSIPRGHLKLIDRISCKRRLEKEMDDSETKTARSFIKKTISGSRGQQLMAALKDSKTGCSMNKKSRRSRLPINPLVAGTYR